jgi:hypothetical protein
MMAVSKKCEQCSKVKRCRMFLEQRVSASQILAGAEYVKDVPVYLCAPCARELGYAGSIA